jgi:predicted amidohydrolase
MVIDPYGRIISSCQDGFESLASALIDMDSLEAFRKKFPVLNDADVL